MDIINFFILLFILAIINTIVASVDLSKFVSANTSIQTVQNLDNFKAVARRQMYQALIQIVLLIGAMIIGIYGLLTHKIGLALVIVLNLVIIGISQLSKKFEVKARSLRVTDQNLAVEYQDICESWVRKALPDF